MRLAKSGEPRDVLLELTPGLAVAAAGVMLLHVLIGVLLLGRLLDGSALGDWRAFFSAGVIVRSEHARELFDLGRQTAVQHALFGEGPIDAYPLPAFAAFVFAPFTYISYTASYLAWLGVNLVTLAALSLCGWRQLSTLPVLSRVAVIAGLVCSTPATMLLFLGQVDLVVLAAMTASFYFVRNGRGGLGGAALALGLFKPHLLIGAVAMLVITRQWRPLASFGAVALVLLAVPMLVLGAGSMLDQARLIQSSPDSTSPQVMANLRGFVYAVTGGDHAAVWLPMTATAGAAALAMSVRVWVRREAGDAQSWALAAMLPLIAAPHLHLHSLVLGASAVVLYAAEAGRLRVLRAGAVWLAYLVVTALSLTSLAGIALLWFAIAAFFSLCVFRWPGRGAAAHSVGVEEGRVRIAA